MTLTIPLLIQSYEKSKQARSRTGYPFTLGEMMLDSRGQGHSYAESMNHARMFGYAQEDIQVWVDGRKLEMSRRRSLGMARRMKL